MQAGWLQSYSSSNSQMLSSKCFRAHQIENAGWNKEGFAIVVTLRGFITVDVSRMAPPNCLTHEP